MLDERLLKAGLEVFNEKGVKFTMDEVAKHLGMSKRTLYEITSSKEVLIDAVIQDAFDAIKIEERSVLADTSLSDLEKLKKLLIILPTPLQTIDYTKMYQIRDAYPKVYEKIAYRLENDWEATIELMQECIEQGVIRPINISLFQRIITGTMEQLLLSEMAETHYVTSLDELIAILFEGIQV